MSPKPEFLFVPGAWHSPDSFEPTTTLLSRHGYTLHGISLPSVGADPQIQSFNPDVQAIWRALDRLLSAGKDVVLVMHSYGGVVGSEAMAGYMRILEEEKEGGRRDGYGRVKRLVYICAFALHEGESLMGTLQMKPLPWFKFEQKDIITPINPQEIFYNDITPAQAAPYISALRTHSWPPLFSKLTVAPYKVIPSTYILCEKDNAIPIGAQEGIVAAAKAAAADAFDVVERCDGGHSPFISQPEWLAEKLIKAAQQ